MLSCIFTKVCPQMIGQHVLRADFGFGSDRIRRFFDLRTVFGMQDRSQLGSIAAAWNPETGKIECRAVAKPDDEETFAILRHEPLSVDEPILNVVLEFFLKRLADDGECSAPVVVLEVLDVLQDER